MSVLLPDPDGPITAVKRPAAMSTETWSSATTSVLSVPYTLTASTARTAAPTWACCGVGGVGGVSGVCGASGEAVDEA